ncbi:MAG: hydrogenase maturation nickel metallochaperone HypA [Candidatus Euphemobacter frigidus]|nr:hydrogenase maturation nickel metallochaperone HypA [Candidatus Euphemobacter frigidus]MDP8275961.1 hydrogenase maturation nickel metallochaperone HypA [Candidatus Euphemobacter frigidus]
MHEWAIADNLVKLVAAAARREDLESVSKVVIRVGALQQVVPETLEMAFRMMAEETEIAGARLKIEPVLLKLRCRNCQTITTGNDFVFTCQKCGGVDLEIISGKELYIDYMEGEKKGT